jgi:RNA polymerase sigma factor (TIGR02999 family)
LLPLVYEELRRLAAHKLARESPGQTIQATALVNEAYLRLASANGAGGKLWDNRGHFFAAAARAMQCILVDRARRKKTGTHGGDRQRLPLDDIQLAVLDEDDKVLAIDEAISKLAKTHPQKAELVKLRFFAGCTYEQAAEALGVSVATAERDWVFARSWLLRELGQDVQPSK